MMIIIVNVEDFLMAVCISAGQPRGDHKKEISAIVP